MRSENDEDTADEILKKAIYTSYLPYKEENGKEPLSYEE